MGAAASFKGLVIEAHRVGRRELKHRLSVQGFFSWGSPFDLTYVGSRQGDNYWSGPFIGMISGVLQMLIVAHPVLRPSSSSCAWVERAGLWSLALAMGNGKSGEWNR